MRALFCIVFLGILLAADDTSSRHVIHFPKRVRHRVITFNLINDNNNNNAHVITQYNTNKFPALRPTDSTVQRTPEDFLSNAAAWCFDHKGIVVAGCCGLAYAAVWVCLAYMEYSIEHYKGWSLWHPEYSYEQLLRCDQKQLARELFESIKKRYLPVTYTAMNFLDPLVSFMEACDAEIALLKRFNLLNEKLEYIKMHYIVPQRQKVVVASREKIERLRYLKNLVVSGLSEYSFEMSV